MKCRQCLTGIHALLDITAVNDEGEKDFSATVCRACFEKDLAKAEDLKRIFSSMTLGGIDRKIANDVMIAYIRSEDLKAVQ